MKIYGKLHFLKKLKPEHEDNILFREALRKEFEIGFRLEHPNIVRYVSFHDDEILMEYVDGEDLLAFLKIILHTLKMQNISISLLVNY